VSQWLRTRSGDKGSLPGLALRVTPSSLQTHGPAALINGLLGPQRADAVAATGPCELSHGLDRPAA
jgi:hypothetical protein